MDELGDDLLLLAARPGGALVIPEKLRFGLSGSELVRLAAAGRVNVVHGRIVVLDAAPTGDALLDEALASMTGGPRQPTAKAWVARQRPKLVGRYLARLEAAGTISAQRRKVLGFIPTTRWMIADPARAARARARLEAVASSTGNVDSAQAALAGLASAIGVTGYVFPGRAGYGARRRLRQAAERDVAAGTVTRAVDGAAGASDAARHAAVDAAASAATRAATDAAIAASIDAATQAAVSAATDAAIAASIDAATQAAVSAATDAAHHAGGHDGGAGGGHH
jgi:hypothetical protein